MKVANVVELFEDYYTIEGVHYWYAAGRTVDLGAYGLVRQLIVHCDPVTFRSYAGVVKSDTCITETTMVVKAEPIPSNLPPEHPARKSKA